MGDKTEVAIRCLKLGCSIVPRHGAEYCGRHKKINRVCEFKGCQKKSGHSRLCAEHAGWITPCSYEGCTSMTQAFLCDKHAGRYGKICKEQDCSKKCYSSNTLCPEHSKAEKKNCEVCGKPSGIRRKHEKCSYIERHGEEAWRVHISEQAKRSRKNNPNQSNLDRNSKHKRRMLLQEQWVENVELDMLYLRDRGMCGICVEVVNIELKAPHRRSATVDHILPVSKGGEHSYANTQLAHFACNSGKKDRII